MSRYQKYPKYKDSGVEWIGEIPEHWEIAKVKYYYDIQLGKMLQPEPNSEYDIEVKYLKAQHVKWDTINTDDLPTMWASKKEIGKFSVNKGDLLICEGGEVGRSTLLEEMIDQCIIQNALHRVKPNTKVSIKFLKYFMQHIAVAKWFDILCNKATIAHLTGEKLGSLKLIVPPLEEQEAIANFLDRKTAQIDELIAKKEALLKKLDDKRSALISHTVTCGLTAKAANEFGFKPHTLFKDSGIEWIGDIPAGWAVLPLRRLIKYVKTGNTPSGAEEHHFEEYGFNWYSPGDFSDDIYLGSANRTLSAEGKAEVRIFPEMTVMFVGIGATIGKVALSTRKSTCNQQINAIVCNNKLDPIFATYYLKTLQDYILKCGKFTTLPIINQEETKNLVVTRPSIQEQVAIATYLNHEIAKIKQLMERINNVIERLREYRSAIIASAVSGSIQIT